MAESRKIPPERIPWFTQKRGSVDCGAVAIMNARLWQGEDVRSSELPILARSLGISQEKCGVSGADLNRWICQKRHFGVERIVQPGQKQAEAILRRGDGFILRYLWELGERRGGHFVFVCPASRRRVLVANPHRIDERKAYEKFRYFDQTELIAAFKKQRIGNRYYPWIWPISQSPV